MKKLSIRMITLVSCAALLFGLGACAKKEPNPFKERSTFTAAKSSDRDLEMTVNVVSGKTIHFEITSKDYDTYMYGRPYTLEYKSGNDWYTVPFLPDTMFTMEGIICNDIFISDDGANIRYYEGEEEKVVPYQDEEEADRIIESVREHLESIREPAENGRVIASDDIDLSEMCGKDLPSGHYRLIKKVSLMDRNSDDCVADYDVVAEFDL